MFYKIILAYLVGIVIAVNFLTDMSFIAVSFIMSFMSFMIYKNHKGHFSSIKDIRVLFEFFFLFAFFLIAIFYTHTQMDSVSYRDYQDRVYDIHGKVEAVKQGPVTQTLTLSVQRVTNLNTNTEESEYPHYLDVNVSSLINFELFDRVNVIGEIEFKNFQNSIGSKPLFFSYEYEKLFFKTNYSVTQPRKIYKESYHKNLYENTSLTFHNLCESLIARVSNHMPEPYGSIAEGISTGEQDNLPKDVKDIFKTSGLIHILVLSGANVSFIISIFLFIISRKKFNLRVGSKVISAIIFAWCFILGTGLTPPSVRAGVMSTTNILSEYFSKNISTVQTLLVSLFVLTLINPLSLIYSPSLHLSFLACLGLFVLAPKLETIMQRKFPKIKKSVNFFISTFIGLFLTTTVYILALSGSSSIFGTLLTFLVEPFVLATTILSFLTILASFIFSPLADLIGILNSLSVKLIYGVAKLGAAYLPMLNFQIGKYELIIFYIFLAIIFSLYPRDIIEEK